MAGQSASAHAHALSPAGQHPLAASFVPDRELLRPPRFHFHFRRSGAELRIGISDGKETMDVPVEWAFGAGEQAVTFVSRLDGDWYLEHYFTYYSAIRTLAPTPGHEGYRSNTLPLAKGVLYRSVDPVAGMVKCFECHSTGPPHIGADREIRPAELGVRCEACHGPGSLHVRDKNNVQFREALNPWKSKEGETTKKHEDRMFSLCFRCHDTDNSIPFHQPGWR